MAFSVYLAVLFFLTFVLSSVNGPYKFHKLAYGTGKTGWALYTCRVWEVKDVGEQQQAL